MSDEKKEIPIRGLPSRAHKTRKIKTAGVEFGKDGELYPVTISEKTIPDDDEGLQSLRKRLDGTLSVQDELKNLDGTFPGEAFFKEIAKKDAEYEAQQYKAQWERFRQQQDESIRWRRQAEKDAALQREANRIIIEQGRQRLKAGGNPTPEQCNTAEKEPERPTAWEAKAIKEAKSQRRRDQFTVIVDVILELKYSHDSIPEGGVRSIRERCYELNPSLFSKDSFEHAWKDAKRFGLVDLEDNTRYMKKP